MTPGNCPPYTTSHNRGSSRHASCFHALPVCRAPRATLHRIQAFPEAARDGHKTSVSPEDAFWTELKKIAQLQGVTMSSLVGSIEATRKHGNLSSAIRIFVLEHLQNKDKRAAPPHSEGAPGERTRKGEIRIQS